MNVILVNALDFPHGSAQSAFVSLMVKGLRENMENVVLVIPYGAKKEPIAGSHRRAGHYDGIPFCFIREKGIVDKGARFIGKYLGVFGAGRLIIRRKRKRKVDAVILGGIVDIIRDLPVILACMLWRVPIYFWLVEKASLNEDYRGVAGFLNHKTQLLTEKLLPRIANGVIVISRNLEMYYRKTIPGAKILLTPILVNSDSRSDNVTECYRKTIELVAGKFKGKRLLVYSGTFGEKDGISTLIEAFSKLYRQFADLYFIMTGLNEDDIVMDGVRDMISKYNLQERVLLTGFLDVEELRCINNLADVLVACRSSSAYANHGFPWKLGEYCMTERPVIATDVSDIGFYFKDCLDMHIVRPDDPDGIAMKIVYILNDLESALRTARLGKETAVREFGYLKKTREVADFLQRNGGG